MYIQRKFPLWGMLKWTRRDIYKFIIIGVVPVFMYKGLGFYWLHLPWLPIGVVGTAVAFIVSFKNNASYDRLWEARKIYGGIVCFMPTFETSWISLSELLLLLDDIDGSKNCSLYFISIFLTTCNFFFIFFCYFLSRNL